MSPVSFQNDIEYEQPVFFQNDIEYEQLEPYPAEVSQKVKPGVTIDKLTAENLKLYKPALYRQLQEKFIEEGKKIERQRLELLRKACGNDARLLGESLLSEDVAAEVLTRAADKLEAENKQMARKLGIYTGAEPTTFMDAVVLYMIENKCSKSHAVDKCADLYPKLHDNLRSGEVAITAEKEYERSQKLQNEFHSVGAYVAFKEREAREIQRQEERAARRSRMEQRLSPSTVV